MPRQRAVIATAIGAVVLLAAIVLLWSKGASGSTAAFCKSVRSGENPLDVFDRYDPSNVDTARDQLQRGLDRLHQLESAAPGQIHDDMKVLVDVAQQLVTALDPSAKDATIPDFTSEFDRVRVASANVTQFASEQCGMQLDRGSSASAATLPPGTPTSPP